MLNKNFARVARYCFQAGASPVIFSVLMILCLAPCPAHSQVSVLTEHNDNARTGQNVGETLLTLTSVNAQQFGKLFSSSVDGYVVAQPLYLPGVTIPGLGTHNVVYVATQHDSVFALDADNNQGTNSVPLWSVSFINPSAGVTTVPISDQGCGGITKFTEVGIMGTPVIDPTTGTLYVSAKTKENGTYVHRLHALDVTTGQEKFGGPVVITASVTGSKGVVSFNSLRQLQRPALLLANGVVYLAFGSNGCDSNARGWVIAYNANTLQQVGVFNTTPDSLSSTAEGSIWQSGGGPGSDSNGYVYFMTANGLFDANSGGLDFGDSMLKLSLGTGGLDWADYFTPYNQATMQSQDLDLGSGGVVLLRDQPGPHPHLIVGAGKFGSIHLVDRDNMGQFNASGDSQIVQEIPGALGQMYSVPAYWNNMVYFTAANDFIKAYSLSNGLLSTTPASRSFSPFQNVGVPSISANGTGNGILWMIRNTGGDLLAAFNAISLKEIYNTNQAGTRDTLGPVMRFATPTVANGKVYVGTEQQLIAYGLFPALSAFGGNNQTGIVGTALPLPLQVLAYDPYSGNPLAGAVVAFSDGGKGGSFSSPNATTSSAGIASTIYTPPQKSYANITITASSPGYAGISFHTSALPGPPATLRGSGNNQTAPVNTMLLNPLVYVVKDTYGNGVPGVQITLSDGSAGGTFSATTPTTNTAGKVSVTYTTPPTPGTVKITATVTGLSPLIFTETVTAH